MFEHLYKLVLRIRTSIPSFRTLRVHCWGGLGSQLFSVSLYFELQQLFPRKTIILSLHQGGVTKRISEISGLFSGIQIEEITDFSDAKESSDKIENAHSAQQSAKKALKAVLKYTRLVLSLDDKDDLKHVKPWTFSIRGHYSYRYLDSNSVNLLRSKLTQDAIERFNKNEVVNDAIGVHYRLGDLINLTTKSPLDVNRLVDVINKKSTEFDLQTVIVFSDSTNFACRSLQSRIPKLNIVGQEEATWETIGSLVKSDLFIGTFSKVSLWVVIFRYYFEDAGLSVMPLESKANLQLILGTNLDGRKIVFYD